MARGDNPILTELCRTNDGEWYPGRLGNTGKGAKYSVAEGSKINAIAQESTKQLKVYFTKKEDAPALSMTFCMSTDDPTKANWFYAAVTSKEIKY